MFNNDNTKDITAFSVAHTSSTTESSLTQFEKMDTNLASAALKQMQEKIVSDLGKVNHLKAEVIRLSKQVVSLTREIEELSGGDGGADSTSASLNVYFEPDPGLESYREQLRGLMTVCVERINQKKHRILQLLTVAEIETSALVQARGDLMGQQIMAEEEEKEQAKKAKIEGSETETEATAKSEAKVSSSTGCGVQSRYILYSKEALMELAKMADGESPPLPPIDPEIKDKFPELFRSKQLQSIRRKSLRSALEAANFC